MTLIADIQQIRAELTEVMTLANNNRADINRHEEQLNGKRGIDTALKELAAEIKSLRKAAYWVAGVIITGSITFAFAALSVVGGGP